MKAASAEWVSYFFGSDFELLVLRPGEDGKMDFGGGRLNVIKEFKDIDTSNCSFIYSKEETAKDSSC